MGMHQKTQKIIQAAYDMLNALNPPGAKTTTRMTVRQIFYQLLTLKIIDNTKGSYQKTSNALVKARQSGTIPWSWIEDRIRQPRRVPMWSGLSSFGRYIAWIYRRNVWVNQKTLVEVWLEKDALSGIFEDALEPYGVTLNVGRGYDGWSSIHGAAQRYQEWDQKGTGDVVILYFGDLDPSGEDMYISLGKRLEFFRRKKFFRTIPKIIKMALNPADVEKYDLPQDYAKKTDARFGEFAKKYGDISVELDALPIDVLNAKIEGGIKQHMDIIALAHIQRIEEKERQQIAAALR